MASPVAVFANVLGGPMGRPVIASHSRAVPERLTVRMVFPSRLNAAELKERGSPIGWLIGEPVAASKLELNCQFPLPIVSNFLPA